MLSAGLGILTAASMFENEKSDNCNRKRNERPQSARDDSDDDRGKPSQTDTKKESIGRDAIYPATDKRDEGRNSKPDVVPLAIVLHVRIPNVK